MIPLIPIILAAIIAAGVADSAVSIYGTNQSTNASDMAAKYTQQFYTGALAENSKYWERYIRAHHLEGRNIMFPYRTGMNMNASALYNANSQLVNNKWAMNRAITGGARRGANLGWPATGLYNNLYG